MAWSIALVRGVGVTHSDAALIARCQKADVAAFNEIVARYKGKIYSYVYRMTGNAEDAEDLTQEVFVKMYGKEGKEASAKLLRLSGRQRR